MPALGRVARFAALVAPVIAIGLAGASYASFEGRNGLIALDRPFLVDPENENFGSFILGVHPRTRERTRFYPCTGDECLDSDPSWSPDGRRLLFSRFVEGPMPTSRVLMVRRDGSGLSTVLEGASHPAWAPSGEELVVRQVVGSDQPPGELYVASTSGEWLRQITKGGGLWPDWSSRGRIAFVQMRRGRRLDIYTTNPAGKRTRRLTRDGCSTDPSWSPSGHALLFWRLCGRRSGVWRMRANGNKKQLLVPRAFAPVWSPTGDRIAYKRAGDVWVARRDGSSPRRIFANVGAIARLAWQPRPR